MTKWDYKVERLSLGFGGGTKKFENTLNIYGDEGYELVTMNKEGVYIFKKQIEN